MEDDFWWKTTYDERQSLMEDDLWRKMTFDKRLPLTEDDFWRKTTFDARWPWRKMTFDGRRTSTEDNLRQKTTFDKSNMPMPDLRTALPFTAVAVISCLPPPTSFHFLQYHTHTLPVLSEFIIKSYVVSTLTNIYDTLRIFFWSWALNKIYIFFAYDLLLDFCRDISDIQNPIMVEVVMSSTEDMTSHSLNWRDPYQQSTSLPAYLGLGLMISAWSRRTQS